MQNLEQRISDTGWFARQFLKIRKSMNLDRQGWNYDGNSYTERKYYDAIHWLNNHQSINKVFDAWYSYGVIGSLTGDDQETYCRLHANHLTPKKITIINSAVFGFGVFLTNYAVADFLGDITFPGYIDAFFDATATTIKGLSAVSIARDIYRIGATMYDQKGRAPWGIQPMILNGPTIAKNIVKYSKQQ